MAPLERAIASDVSPRIGRRKVQKIFQGRVPEGLLEAAIEVWKRWRML